jgi:hypothetical protein
MTNDHDPNVCGLGPPGPDALCPGCRSPHRNGDDATIGTDGPSPEATEQRDGAKSNKPRFPDPIRCSELHAAPEGVPWLWHGCLARRAVTLFSALWKSGKTTLLANLLKTLDAEETFCGLPVAQAKVLYVTEESEQRWAERRDQLGLGDWCRFLVRPFLVKPRWDAWQAFISHVAGLLAHEPADLVIFDTLSNLWSVRDENDAGQVQEALMPLHQLTGPHNCALMLVHHVGKSDSSEAKASRGSGALPSFADIILELRRYDKDARQDRRRVITGYGRWDDVPSELVIELTADGKGYIAHGDKEQVASGEMREIIRDLLPNEPPGCTWEQIRQKWPQEPAPGKPRLLGELGKGSGTDWSRNGGGKRGSPYTYWRNGQE